MLLTQVIFTPNALSQVSCTYIYHFVCGPFRNDG